VRQTIGEIRGNTGAIPEVLPHPKRLRRVTSSSSTERMSVTFDAPFSAAVLFADMRGYTGLAERLPPTRVVTLLDEFFAILASAIAAYGGQVFYVAGDGMMAGFRVRGPGRSGAREALAAAQAMLRRFAPVSTRWRHDLSLVTGIGVGLHLGAVAFGFLGPPGRKTVTLIGDTVNVAARLCSCARAGEVLFSSTVAAALVTDGAVQHRPTVPRPFLHLPQVQLRGRNDLLDIWCAPAVERTHAPKNRGARIEADPQVLLLSAD
jgi:class 3 adenylate cyclase